MEVDGEEVKRKVKDFSESSPDEGEVNSRKKKRGRRSPVDPPGDNPLKAVFSGED